MISFAPTDDQKLMIEASQKLAKTLAARIRDTEKSGLSAELREAVTEMGLGVAHLPASVGGAGPRPRDGGAPRRRNRGGGSGGGVRARRVRRVLRSR